MTSAMAHAIVDGGQRGPMAVTVLYDERCPLCRRLKSWLGGQRTLVRVEFLAADSAAAHRRYPDLDHVRTTTVLTAIAADGAVYEGERAWMVCAWTLPAWNSLAENLSTGKRLRLVRLAARVIDGYRHRLIAASTNESCDECRVAAPRG
jgi:predicted DCC family thiol-disulfide oxidoreductase YuxK